jgi:RimJ/RimL family protein N-acetyltransferase
MQSSDQQSQTGFTERPTLTTARLVLRPYRMDDAPDVQRLAGDREVARNTMLIPHPYEDGEAERWIGTHQEIYESGQGVTFAITQRDNGELVGSIGLVIFEKHHSGELGYWIGKPYWNNGYCTEASLAILDYGFETRKLHRIHAKCYVRNPASGRVMQKIGMQHEGTLRHHLLKWDVYEDVEAYAILEDEYRAN